MKLKVLLVDDEKDILMVMSELLEILDKEVFVASSGTKALEVCSTEDIDVVITDYEMPDMNGFDLAKEIIKINPKIKIYLLSGYARIMTEDMLKESGISRVIDKPFKIDDIQRIFEELD